jgi:RNA polymerase sigma-70 factor (ECF subfamily)
MNSAFTQRDQLETSIAGLLASADRRAIALIYENYAETLLGLVKRIVESQEAAEEVLQDVFVKIWKNARKYDRSKGRLFTWFANIARNTAIDYTRAAGSRKQKKTTSTENIVNISKLGITESSIPDSGLQKVLDSLDEKYRVLIDLAYFQGYSQSEIEKELNIPLGTIKTRLRAAINELRVLLKDDMNQQLLFGLVVVISELLNTIT